MRLTKQSFFSVAFLFLRIMLKNEKKRNCFEYLYTGGEKYGKFYKIAGLDKNQYGICS